MGHQALVEKGKWRAGARTCLKPGTDHRFRLRAAKTIPCNAAIRYLYRRDHVQKTNYSTY